MIRLLLGLLLVAAPAWAATERAAAERVVAVAETRRPPPLDPADAAWGRAPASSVRLHPQATVPGGPGGAAVPLDVRVLRGGGRLAVRLAWADAGEDRSGARATDRFADAVAVQFAPAARTLPYVGMGEPGNPVRLWYWRAGGSAERLTAQGFGSLARQAGAAPEARARRTADGWAVVLRGKPDGGFAALAFAAWDGAEDGRAGRKRLSAWHVLGATDGRLPAALREEARLAGDPVRGARLFVERGCVACHAPNVHAGPDLSHAGGIHWPGYLRRAIREPAAFLVPGYPAIMPGVDLGPGEVEDLVAHLMTLH